MRYLPDSLEELDLSHTKITNKGISYIINSLLSLKKLSLCRTEISERGIKSLSFLPSLIALNLRCEPQASSPSS